jgi:hypothetical protein
VFYAGVFFGVITSATLIARGNSEKMEEAYNKGIEEGKRIVTNKNK